MIFVDTGVWYAANVLEDPDHSEARQLVLRATSPLITTDYVVDELLTLLIARKRRNIAVRIGDGFWRQASCDLEWVKTEDVESAWNVFLSFRRQDLEFHRLRELRGDETIGD
jgi:predicted nucleic acid-binding protein